jgi:hypothetical protein
MDSQLPTPVVVKGVTDTAPLTLTELAQRGDWTSLRRVLPVEDVHLPVCAFGSSI